MSEWLMPWIFGAALYALGNAPVAGNFAGNGKPLNQFSRALRSYETNWAVGEGYLMLGPVSPVI
jgi:hypothetical protein